MNPIAGCIGRRLIATVADRLIQQGHYSMLVWVLTANASRLLYEALGGVLHPQNWTRFERFIVNSLTDRLGNVEATSSNRYPTLLHHSLHLALMQPIYSS